MPQEVTCTISGDQDPGAGEIADLPQLRAAFDALSGVIDDLGAVVPAAFTARLDALRARVRAFDPCVGVIGQVKAGKTSVANALIGMPDLLPSDVNPWTSVVTSVHLNRRAPGGHRAVFRFFDDSDWVELTEKGGRLGRLAQRDEADGEAAALRAQVADLRARTSARLGHNYHLLLGQSHRFAEFDGDLLRRYVCLGDDADPRGDGRFSDLTRAADLYLDAADYGLPLTIRDTPGVNDPFLVREQMTLNALEDSAVCVLVLSAYQALSSVDLGLLHLLRTMPPESVVLFVNRIDELEDPAPEIVRIERSIRAVLARKGLEDRVPIIFGSARWAGDAATGRVMVGPGPVRDFILGFSDPDDSDGEAAAARNLRAASGIDALRDEIAGRIARGSGRALLQSAVREVGGIIEQARLHLDALPTRLPDGGDLQADAMAADLRADCHRRLDAIEAAAAEALVREGREVVERWVEGVVQRLPALLAEGGGVIDTGDLRAELMQAYGRASQSILADGQVLARDIRDGLHRIYGTVLSGAACLFPIYPPALGPGARPVALARQSSLEIRRNWADALSMGRGREMRQAARFRRTVGEEFGQLVTELGTGALHSGLAGIRTTLDTFLDGHFDTLRTLASPTTTVSGRLLVESRAAGVNARLDAVRARVEHLAPLAETSA